MADRELPGRFAALWGAVPRRGFSEQSSKRLALRRNESSLYLRKTDPASCSIQTRERRACAYPLREHRLMHLLMENRVRAAEADSCFCRAALRV